VPVNQFAVRVQAIATTSATAAAHSFVVRYSLYTLLLLLLLLLPMAVRRAPWPSYDLFIFLYPGFSLRAAESFCRRVVYHALFFIVKKYYVSIYVRVCVFSCEIALTQTFSSVFHYNTLLYVRYVRWNFIINGLNCVDHEIIAIVILLLLLLLTHWAI